jgi:hypothetical protein
MRGFLALALVAPVSGGWLSDWFHSDHDEHGGKCDSSTLHGRYIFATTGTIDLSSPRDGKGTTMSCSGGSYYDGQGNGKTELTCKPWSGDEATDPAYFGTIWETYKFNPETCLAERTDQVAHWKQGLFPASMSQAWTTGALTVSPVGNEFVFTRSDPGPVCETCNPSVQAFSGDAHRVCHDCDPPKNFEKPICVPMNLFCQPEFISPPDEPIELPNPAWLPCCDGMACSVIPDSPFGPNPQCVPGLDGATDSTNPDSTLPPNTIPPM